MMSSTFNFQQQQLRRRDERAKPHRARASGPLSALLRPQKVPDPQGRPLQRGHERAGAV